MRGGETNLVLVRSGSYGERKRVDKSEAETSAIMAVIAIGFM